MRKKLLIVEDSPFQAAALQIALSEIGCESSIAADGTEAMDILTDDIELVIVDNTLPDIKGFDLCRKLKAIQTEKVLTVIITSSEEITTDDIKSAREIGAVDYVSKSENFKYLIEIVKGYLT